MLRVRVDVISSKSFIYDADMVTMVVEVVGLPMG